MRIDTRTNEELERRASAAMPALDKAELVRHYIRLGLRRDALEELESRK